MTSTRSSGVFAALAALVGMCLPVRAEMSAEELAKMAQNPVGNPTTSSASSSVTFRVN